MTNLNELGNKELLNLLVEYDKYIQEANEEDKYKTGWKPVCIQEFWDNDYLEIFEDDRNDNNEAPYGQD